VRYLDSATRQVDQTAHGWLAAHLPEATALASQTGYFRYDAIAPFTQEILRVLQRGGRFDLAIGANEDVLRAPDLEDVLALLRPWLNRTATFTLVAARDALFHPKTIYVEGRDGRRAALVGSGNLTGSGMRSNFEAALALDEHDDPAVLDAIRDAILTWPANAGSGSHAQPITQHLIDALMSDGAIVPTRLPLGEQRRSPRSRFPKLGRIPGTPTSGRPPRPRTTPPIPQLGRATGTFPVGTTGIVKRLSRTDLKGFFGEPGTPYVALPPNPADLAARLPMRPSGANAEPRLNLAVEARLDGALRHIVTSGKDVANITHVGAGSSRISHRDLRLNLLHSVVGALIAAASQTSVRLPAPGDALAVEFLDGGRLARLTFAGRDPLRTTLLGQLHPGRSWGWLTAGLVPPW
jgi:hypothetical protein